MAVCVMHVRRMRMLMRHRLMAVRMRVWLSRRVIGRVCMTVVAVMHMRVRVLHRLVAMRMLMTFGQVQPYAARHQQSRERKLQRHRLAKHDYGKRGSKEWCRTEIGSGSRRA
jgi:hypothetical protein